MKRLLSLGLAVSVLLGSIAPSSASPTEEQWQKFEKHCSMQTTIENRDKVAMLTAQYSRLTDLSNEAGRKLELAIQKPIVDLQELAYYINKRAGYYQQQAQLAAEISQRNTQMYQELDTCARGLAANQ